MFERFTEKARRTVFLPVKRVNCGSQEITSEHLLLGLLRDDKAVLRHLLLKIDYESVRNQIVARVQPGDLKLPLNVDLPLSEENSHGRSGPPEHRYIGTEHRLLGMLRDADFPCADFESLRTKAAEMRERFAVHEKAILHRETPNPCVSTIIHDKKVTVDAIQTTALFLKQHPFYWERRQWQARDVVYERNGKCFSFDATLAQDTEEFLLVKGGCGKDHCAVCRWELFETDDFSHGMGFTNGAVWVCEECYQRFIAEDSSHHRMRKLPDHPKQALTCGMCKSYELSNLLRITTVVLFPFG